MGQLDEYDAADRARLETQNATAQCIAVHQWLLSEARVYRLKPPIRYAASGCREWLTNHVVVSAVPTNFEGTGPEAMAFACDAAGELIPDGRHTSLGFARSTCHDDAIRALGYTVLPDAPHIAAATAAATAPMTDEQRAACADAAADFNTRLAASRLRLREALDAVADAMKLRRHPASRPAPWQPKR